MKYAKSLSIVFLNCLLFAATQALAQSPLADTQWQFVEFQSMEGGPSNPTDPTVYKMHLNEDGTVTMTINCNRAKGTWSAEPSSDPMNGRFNFGPLAVTSMVCPPPSMDELITVQAQYVRGYLLKGDRLYLSLMADGGIFVWESMSKNSDQADLFTAPESGGVRNWETTSNVNLRERPTAESTVIEMLEQGTVLDNLGCTEAADGIWCDVQKFGGGTRGYVKADYLKPAVSPDGSAAYGPDDSALRAGQGDFDATGQIPCSSAAGQPTVQCQFRIARAGGGYATVVVSKADGSERVIYFRMGIPIGSDDNTGAEFKASRENDLHVIRIGSERYEIPEAAILGG